MNRAGNLAGAERVVFSARVVSRGFRLSLLAQALVVCASLHCAEIVALAEDVNPAVSGAQIEEAVNSAKTHVGNSGSMRTAATKLPVEFVGGEAAEKLLIGQGLAAGQYQVSRLTKPERVVIDITSANSRIAANDIVSPSGSKFVSRVRVGAHSDKTRVVVDLTDQSANSSATKDSAELIDGKIVLTLQPGASLSVATAPQIPADAPASEVAANNQAGFVSNVVLEPVAAGKNMLIADLDAARKFQMVRTSPSEYVLTLQGVSLGAEVPESLVVGPQAGAIRSVRPVETSAGVELRIFADPSVELKARSSGKTVVVSAIPAAVASNDGNIDGRAQMADPAAKTEKAEVTKSPEGKSADAKAAEGAAANAAGAEAVKVDEAAANEADAAISSLLEETPKYTGRLISLDLQDTDIDNALRIIAEVSNLNIIASEDVTGKVTLRLIDVPWDQALDVILKTNGLDKVQEGNVIRIAPVEKLRQEREALKQAIQAEDDLEPLSVKYIRISYSKAADLKQLVEAVLTERGTVTYDDRTNQLIVKDIRKGIKNVAELVAKVDLRTPQVLLETQIVEASRSLLRDLGSELAFSFVQAPELGNATGRNFPNSIDLSGGRPGGAASTFPSSGASGAAGSALGLVLKSADGSATVATALSALEDEGRIRVVSRPSVATTNNKQATIKSVEKIRVKVPSGGLSVATGAGSSASGGAGVATETIEVGITLDVTPQASPDYYVLLDINAKSSTFGSRTVDGIPSEVERSATSTVLVSSGQTFAMGGIYKINDRDALTGVPYLSDIPVLGTFFRRQLVDKSDEELLFFITPRIIEGSFDDAAMKVQS